MSCSIRRQSLVLGLILATLSFAPAPMRATGPDLKLEPSKLEALAQARLQAAIRQYEETWTYYQQARIDSYQVYVWSKLILDSHRDLAEKPADHLAALDEHLARMRKLEALIKKVRRLGFGRSYDVGASEYYSLEAEYWLAREKAVRK